MNSITFYVDLYDNVLNCFYKENYKSLNTTRLYLSNNNLKEVFFSLLKSFPEPKVVEENGYNKVTFYDIDVDLIDKLLEQSNKNLDQYHEDIKNAKVVRTNKFKKVFIKTTAGLLASLMVFASAKEALSDTFPMLKRDTLTVSEIEEKKSDKHDKIKFVDGTFEKEGNVQKEENVQKDDNLDKNDNIVEAVSLEQKVQPVELPPVVNIPEEIKIDSRLYLDIKSMVNSEKYNVANSYYFDTLTKIALRYGVDPYLALAIATHERGKHSNEVDFGGAIGLFQIQVEGAWNWNNKTITAYNFETNQYEDFLITTEAVSDVFVNMQVGCMMIQNLLTSYNYDVAKSVTAYNYGSENLRVVLEKCAAEENISMEEFNDPNNIQWLKYRDIISGGDPQYLENVFKYIPDGTVLNFTKPNGEVVTIEYDNLYEENNSSFTQ